MDRPTEAAPPPEPSRPGALERAGPYAPETDGGAERLVRASLRERAYATPHTSAERAATTHPRPNAHDTARPHAAGDNVSGNDN